MMLCGGKAVDGTQIVPEEIVKDLEKGGTDLNVQQFANKLDWAKNMVYEEEKWVYRNQYWIAPERSTYTQIGIYGQVSTSPQGT